MSTQITLRISILLAVLVVVPSSLAQPSPQKKSPADPQNKPRKVRPEPAKAFKVWIDEVEPILTPDERNAWNKLQDR